MGRDPTGPTHVSLVDIVSEDNKEEVHQIAGIINMEMF